MSDDSILMDFKKIVQRIRIVQVIVVIGMLLLFVPEILGKEEPWMIILGFIIMLPSAIYALFIWRCPVCGRRLPSKEPIRQIKHCISCGERLQL